MLSLWIKSEHTSLLTVFCPVKLVSGIELFLSVCIAGLLTKAGTGSQQKVKPGKLEERSGFGAAMEY